MEFKSSNISTVECNLDSVIARSAITFESAKQEMFVRSSSSVRSSGK